MENSNLHKIEESIQNIIQGKEKNAKTLKKELDIFFKNKNQEFFNNFPKEKIKALTDVNDLVSKDKKLTGIDLAKLDYWFNKPMKRYFAFSAYEEITNEQLKKFTRYIYDLDKIFSKKQRDAFLHFIAWTWINECNEDNLLENKKKDISIDIDLGPDYSKENKQSLGVLALSTKEHELILNRIKWSLEK